MINFVTTTGEFYFENKSGMLDEAGNSHALSFAKKRYDTLIDCWSPLISFLRPESFKSLKWTVIR